MKNLNPKITEYIDNAPEYSKPILTHLREIIHLACLDLEEKIKWGMPHFDYKGPMCGMAAFKNHTVLGFSKESLLQDPDKIFGEKMQAMGSLGKITKVEDLPSDEILIRYIHAAMQLNIEGKKVTKTKHPKKEILMPKDFAKVLENNESAKEIFEKLSPSHKREYLEWITSAKREETRENRINKAIEMLSEGKNFNWKYEK